MNDAPALSTNQLPEVTTKLEALAARANEAHRRVLAAAGEGLLSAFEAGQSLLQARKTCLGQWLAWLGQNFNASARTAQRYMAFAEECHSLGGFDSTRVSQLPPQELGRIWSELLGRRAGKKTPRLPAATAAPVASDGASVPAVNQAAKPAADPIERAPATKRLAPLPSEAAALVADPLPPLVALFSELIEGFRRVCAGDDGYDGPYAESVVTDLEPHYADLLEYMEYRQEWRSQPGYTGLSSP